MYKLLIVEDEDMLREALLSSVDWPGLGYEARGAEDGEQALSIALEFQPDIVLTDIRMPFMDGLQLSAKLKETLPGAMVAILSGHDEFAYAQEALKLGVREYLQKPVPPAELVAAVKRLERQVDAARVREHQLSRMRRQLDQAMPLMRQKLLNQLLEKELGRAEVEDMLRFVGMPLSGESFTVCLIDFESDGGAGRDRALMECAALDIIKAEAKTDAAAFELNRGGAALIYCARTVFKEKERSFVAQLIEAIRSELYEQLDLATTAAIGEPVDHLWELNRSYLSARQALRSRVMLGRYNTYDAYDHLQEARLYPFDEAAQLLQKVRQGSREELVEGVRDYFETLRAAGALSEENLRVLTIDLLNGAFKLTAGAGKADPARLEEAYRRAFHAQSISDCEKIASEQLLSAQAHLEEARASSGNQLIEGACAFIERHYADPDMSLNSAAAHVFVSPTYLSILFKKKLGITFIDYLINLRLEKAKTLLRDTAKRTYEVAAETGYSDPQYFSVCFKKYTGLTPTEYRAQHR
jgi:two-component system response regulator YesN